MSQPEEFSSDGEILVLPDEEYYSSLAANGIVGLSPEEMARDYESAPQEWYHLYLHDSDFPLIINTPGIKWYAICRCFFAGDWSGRNTDSHCHALVHLKEHLNLKSYKYKMRNAGIRTSRKTTFRKVLCLDNAVDILHYISCSYAEGPAMNLEPEGYHNIAHLHTDRIVFDSSWLHDKGLHPQDKYTRCTEMRDKMSERAASGVSDLSKYESSRELHAKQSCLCKRGEPGIARRDERGRHLRALYVGEKGLLLKQAKLEKALRTIAKKKEDFKRKKHLTSLSSSILRICREPLTAKHNINFDNDNNDIIKPFVCIPESVSL